MADNKIHIAAGIIPNDTGELESSNQIFIAAGLIPDDAAVAGVTMPLFIHHQNQMRQ